MRPGNPEFEFLCSIARPRPDFETARRLLDGGVDGDALFALAAQHGVRPQLAAGLSRLDGEASIPASLREQLEAFRRQHLVRSLTIAGELASVTSSLTEAGIAFAAFKGPVLALQLYGDIAHREYADIDLLVPADRAEAAERVLASRGYGNRQGDRAFRQAFLWHQRQVELTRPGFDSSVDLHWHFTADPLPFPLAPDEVWSTLSSVTVGGRSIPALAGEELALLLAGHGTKEGWQNLVWVCDFAMLVASSPEIDWSRVFERARRRGSGNSVLLAFLMARRLLDTPVPAMIAAEVERRRDLAHTVEQLASGMIAGREEGARRPHLQDVLLCDRLRDRAWAGVKLALMPTPGDHEAMKLPPALWPLYWLTRPFRLVLKALGLRVRRRA